jgi:hypothetical protein
MTTTPITDKAYLSAQSESDKVDALLACCEQLERKLNYEKERECNALKSENTRLREALRWAEPYVPKVCETRKMIEDIFCERPRSPMLAGRQHRK